MLHRLSRLWTRAGGLRPASRIHERLIGKVVPRYEINDALYGRLSAAIAAEECEPEMIIRTIAFVLAAAITSPDVPATDWPRLEAIALQDVALIIEGSL